MEIHVNQNWEYTRKSTGNQREHPTWKSTGNQLEINFHNIAVRRTARRASVGGGQERRGGALGRAMFLARRWRGRAAGPGPAQREGKGPPGCEGRRGHGPGPPQLDSADHPIRSTIQVTRTSRPADYKSQPTIWAGRPSGPADHPSRPTIRVGRLSKSADHSSRPTIRVNRPSGPAD